MSVDIVKYVQKYIPTKFSEIFSEKMDKMIKLCVRQILNKHLQNRRPEHILSTLRFFFPTSIINEYSYSYRHILDVEFLLVAFSLHQPYEAGHYIHKHLKVLSKHISIVMEGFITELVEIYFLNRRNTLFFWTTVEQDSDLHSILLKFNIHPLIRIKGFIKRPYIIQNSSLNKASITLLDSLVVALIKNNYKQNGIQTSTT